jgi:hypothetical protein
MESLYTRETLDGLFRTKKPNLAPRSYTTYVNAILRIQRAIGQPTENELEEWLDQMKPTQARNFMTPVMIMYDGRQRRLFDKYNAQANSALDQQRLSPSEAVHWVQKKTVKKMILRLKEDCTTHGVFKSAPTENKWRLRQMYVIWTIHYELPWRNILHNCKVIAKVKDYESGNAYCLREQSFLIAEFKTKSVFKRHGHKLPLKHRVPGHLARLITKHMSNRTRVAQSADRESEFLFCGLHGRPLSKGAYSNLLTGASKKYLAKRIGSGLWRHIFLTYWSRIPRTLLERRKVAFLMHQHSLITQMRYVRPEVE